MASQSISLRAILEYFIPLPASVLALLPIPVTSSLRYWNGTLGMLTACSFGLHMMKSFVTLAPVLKIDWIRRPIGPFALICFFHESFVPLDGCCIGTSYSFSFSLTLLGSSSYHLVAAALPWMYLSTMSWAFAFVLGLLHIALLNSRHLLVMIWIDGSSSLMAPLLIIV